MKSRPLRVAQLFPAAMNIYGDHGNRQVLTTRAGLYGFALTVDAFEPGDDPGVLTATDIVLGGGGQDSGQQLVARALGDVGDRLRDLVDDGAPMLVICGLYQLFGHWFAPADGPRLEGIGVFDAQTTAGSRRLIGNITVDSAFGRLVGYENHSGLTMLNAGQEPLGTVVAGAGNNGSDGHEGARTHNAIGTYLHGPLLPKNPALADELLRLAVSRRYGEEALAPLDGAAAARLAHLDDLATQARAVAASRPR